MKRIACLLSLVLVHGCGESRRNPGCDLAEVKCNVEEAVAQARRFQIPMSLALSKYKAVQTDSVTNVVRLAVDIDGDRSERLFLEYGGCGTNILSVAELVTTNGKVRVEYNEDASPFTYVKHPSGFFVMFQKNQQPQWYWSLSNEFAVGSWLIFDKDGKLQEQIKFDCPTMMTIDKKGEGGVAPRPPDCIEIDSNDVPLDDVGMTPNREIECTPPLEIGE